MNAVFQAQSYEFDSLSVPFIATGGVLVVVALYVAFMRGAAMLRAALLVITLGLLPFMASLALVGSTTDRAVASDLYRLGLATVPLASAGALLLLLALAHQMTRHRVLLAVAFASSILIGIVSVATDKIVTGVWQTPSGLLYFSAPVSGFAQLHPMMIGGWVVLGIFLIWRRIGAETSMVRRRQLRGAALAFAICIVGLVDVPLAYQVGWYPISWLFLTVGLLLSLRLILADDLLRAEALDHRVPLMMLYVVVGGLAVCMALRELGPGASLILTALVLATIFMALRIAIALVQSLAGGGTATRVDTPLERAVSRFAKGVQSLHSENDISRATTELIELGLGAVETEFLVPSSDDYSWERIEEELVETIPEAATPDPLILGWILDHARPLVRDELEGLRLGDLRESIERLFESHHAEAIVPFVNRDEMVGMLAIGSGDRALTLRRDEITFLERLQEQVTSALVYCRMHREATNRVEVDKEVGLAAAVQAAFVPKGDMVRCGVMAFSGVYEPASRCGGDWWSVHELPGERVLVLIGDVTGHGIAAAMVTAAAKGCYDVAQRLMGAELDVVRLLDLLDASVRRAGADQFYMTCFATLLDPGKRIVTYANAGHVVPYVCQPREGGHIELDALVARGNPLGAGARNSYRAVTREISSGDIFIWYTDGIVECANPHRKQFGDRRMQRLLRKIDPANASVQSIRNDLVRAAVAFQEGQAPDDDITLVVGRID